MSHQGGDQAVWVTKGREEIVAERYREIKKIIQENTTRPFKEAIEIIAGVSVGTWYNYISHGRQRGRVSKYTVDKLSSFSGLPVQVFTGELDFTAEQKKIFKEKVMELERHCYAISAPISKTEESILTKLRSIGNNIDNINTEEEIEQGIQILQKLQRILEKKKEIIKEKNSL